MSDDTERTVVKRSSNHDLMPPPPPRKRIKRPAQVLDEDVYADAVSHIIARDFFPGLVETEAQNQYLSALQSKDREWIQQAGRNLTAVMTPGPDGRRGGRGTSFTPRRTNELDDTPIIRRGDSVTATPVPSASDERPTPLDVDTNMSLGAFQSKYTSEDNESFNELLETQNHRRVTKYAYLFHGNKIPSKRQIQYRSEAQKLIGAGSAQSQELVVSNSAGQQRQLLAPGRPSEDLDTRPATVDSFRDRQGPRNAFMFNPDSVEDTFTTAAKTAEEVSKAPPKSITYSATRFSGTDISQNGDRPPSPTLSTVDAVIARRGSPPASSADFSGSETPRVNGYAFVDAEPTPAELGVPLTDEDADEEERKAFDRLLPKVELGERNPFTIAQQSKREDLHHKLVEKSDSGRRKTGRLDDLRRLGVTPGRTPTPSFTTAPRKNAGQMTPAARNLAAKLATSRRGW